MTASSNPFIRSLLDWTQAIITVYVAHMIAHLVYQDLQVHVYSSLSGFKSTCLL